MELLINNDLTALEEITFNYDDLHKQLTNKLSTYQGLVYDDDQIKEAKEDRASLNKLKTAMDNKRKEVKNILNVPYQNFEVKVKELLELVQKPIDEIDKQVKLAEEKAKIEKRKQIEEFYEENGDKRLKLSRVFREQWLNSSMSMKKVQDELMSIVAGFSRDLQIIEDMQSIFKDKLINYYIDTQDLGYVMSEKNKLDNASKVVEKKQEEAEEPKKEAEEPKKEAEEPKKEAGGMQSLTIKITTDKERMSLLKDFIVMNQIKYERIS